MTLCSIGVVARQYGVSASAIRRWAAKGLLTVASRTLGRHRRFELDSTPIFGDSDGRKHVGYARVSSHDQKEDLQRQAQRSNGTQQGGFQLVVQFAERRVGAHGQARTEQADA